ncbi:twin-arginine translocation signal domain-containing protein [Pseudochrobactrum asaccharolyticum]|uniref:Secreted protein n=1 Tax=Pseudochrobactrum asaccharolyticum TaxID=354351 RepID=A0A366DLR1_9HYPH|nr:twin-arginine translocation signal domain-containing protein [Pseudochrobactrum asaccharolyticum]RBO91023.1 secreted protein [Pseudochrobactrum asaccharolyticum]
MNRRSFLRAAPVAGAVMAAPALDASSPMTLEELCDYHIEKLCEAM